MNNLSLALSGGGDKGAYTVGVLKQLTEQGNEFRQISGTSTGALIAPFLAIEDIERLEDIYTNVSAKNVLYTGSPLLRAVKEGGLYSVDPLRNLLEKNLNEDVYKKIMSSGVEIFISTVCLQNMQTTYFTNSETAQSSTSYDIVRWRDRSGLIRAIMASCVQPVIMPPEKIFGAKFIDGGVKDYLPVEILIDNSAEDITGILTTTGKRYYDSNDFESIFDIALKTIEIFSNDVSQNDLKIAKLYNAGIRYISDVKERLLRMGVDAKIIDTTFTSYEDPFYKKRLIDLRIIRPSGELGDGLTFDTDEMKAMFQKGYNQILNLIPKGEKRNEK